MALNPQKTGKVVRTIEAVLAEKKQGSQSTIVSDISKNCALTPI